MKAMRGSGWKRVNTVSGKKKGNGREGGREGKVDFIFSPF